MIEGFHTQVPPKYTKEFHEMDFLFNSWTNLSFRALALLQFFPARIQAHIP